MEEVWLTPPVPYTGQTFSSKQEAREFYNSYAKRIGFSIRTSTTRLSSLTREQNKVQFVCNKEGRGGECERRVMLVQLRKKSSTAAIRERGRRCSIQTARQGWLSS